jgi:hypothetical protein
MLHATYVAAGSLNSESTDKFQCSVLDIVNKQTTHLHASRRIVWSVVAALALGWVLEY